MKTLLLALFIATPTAFAPTEIKLGHQWTQKEIHDYERLKNVC